MIHVSMEQPVPSKKITVLHRFSLLMLKNTKLLTNILKLQDEFTKLFQFLVGVLAADKITINS